MKLGYLTDTATPEVIWKCIHFPTSTATCSYIKYESVSSLIRGISIGEIDFGIIMEDIFKNYLIHFHHAEKPPDHIQVIARFLILEFSNDTTLSNNNTYTLYSLIG